MNRLINQEVYLLGQHFYCSQGEYNKTDSLFMKACKKRETHGVYYNAIQYILLLDEINIQLNFPTV